MPQTTDNLMSLDVGDSRIGVAIASAPSMLPSPLITISNDNNTVQAIVELLEENKVSKLIVGLPRGLDGQDTMQTQKVRKFVQNLSNEIETSVVFQDEALTSVDAKQELENRGISYNKGDVDALAATYILRDYVNENRENIK